LEQLNSYLTRLRAAYNQQRPWVRVLIPGLVFLLFCCTCSGLVSLFRLGQRTPPTSVASPILSTSEGTQPTPTPLFDFDFPTLTPFPTLPFPSALPSLTPPPTLSPVPTQTPLPASATPLPTMTSPPTIPPATATPTRVNAVEIITVNKVEEYVEIRNFTADTVNLNDWRLVSEVGNQSCRLRGRLPPNEVLRIWARRGEPGLDCRFSDNIWRDNVPDPAVLYNAQGQEVSRFP